MLKKFWESIFGKKIGKTRVRPVTLKIVITFTIFILVSNLSSNYINLSYNLSQLVAQMKTLMVKELKELNDFCNNQHEIYRFNQDMPGSIKAMEDKSRSEFRYKKSMALAVRPDGSLLFQASPFEQSKIQIEPQALTNMLNNQEKGVLAGSETLKIGDWQYISVYRYNSRWNVFLIRGEETTEFYEKSRSIFYNVSIIIVAITLFSAILGILILRYILRYVRMMTDSIMRMGENQQMELIDISHANADDITFLGAAFNSLSSTINNLLIIFRRFVSRDVAQKAYRDKYINLEGSQMELTILFSDIKGFTFITETLGTDIIKLLNLHYDQAIRSIYDRNGVIGSIIGDALLAVFGTYDIPTENKSYQAIMTAYELQDVATQIRLKMHSIREKIMQERGALTSVEEGVYKAVLLEIGVGIDGGEVFYGNIGSSERMTNTVIGDNVNSASRLEGLTRVYHAPVIISEFVKEDIEQNVQNHGLKFFEIDTVQVKGKTIGKKVFWPIMEKALKEDVKNGLAIFGAALQLYYKGDWAKAYEKFNQCQLPLAEVFLQRTKNNKCPEGWKGIWTMKTK